MQLPIQHKKEIKSAESDESPLRLTLERAFGNTHIQTIDSQQYLEIQTQPCLYQYMKSQTSYINKCNLNDVWKMNPANLNIEYCWRCKMVDTNIW